MIKGFAFVLCIVLSAFLLSGIAQCQKSQIYLEVSWEGPDDPDIEGWYFERSLDQLTWEMVEKIPFTAMQGTYTSKIPFTSPNNELTTWYVRLIPYHSDGLRGTSNVMTIDVDLRAGPGATNITNVIVKEIN